MRLAVRDRVEHLSTNDPAGVLQDSFDEVVRLDRRGHASTTTSTGNHASGRPVTSTMPRYVPGGLPGAVLEVEIFTPRLERACSTSIVAGIEHQAGGETRAVVSPQASAVHVQAVDVAHGRVVQEELVRLRSRAGAQSDRCSRRSASVHGKRRPPRP